MNLFENLIKLNESESEEMDINELLSNAQIPFSDNKENYGDNDTGRYTLYDGLMELFEPDEDVDIYQLYLTGEIEELDDTIKELKELEMTGAQLKTLIDIVGDSIYTFDNEDVHEILINAFPIDEIPEDSEEIDEIVIEEESIKVEEDANADYRATRRIEYIRDILNSVDEKALPNSVYPLITKMYSLAVEIEDEMQKNKRH